MVERAATVWAAAVAERRMDVRHLDDLPGWPDHLRPFDMRQEPRLVGRVDLGEILVLDPPQVIVGCQAMDTGSALAAGLREPAIVHEASLLQHPGDVREDLARCDVEVFVPSRVESELHDALPLLAGFPAPHVDDAPEGAFLFERRADVLVVAP